MYNEKSLDTLCAALSYAIGIEPPKHAADKNSELCEFVDKSFNGEKADRILMYNPDAIAQWIYEKYPQLMKEAIELGELKLPLKTVMPSVTPVCFGTMYTGAQPAVHGITKYEKPVIKIDTFFDALIRAGKRVAIVATPKSSIANIFLERELDYFIEPNVNEVNAKAAQVILEDKHDVIVVYNGNYDALMHKHSPEGLEALCELRSNSHQFAAIAAMVAEHWQEHNTLLGFAMDHGCHEIDGGCGSHGLDMEEDLNIVHLYRAFPKSK
jgi:predicted AlkP superfamily pyrophosphatase or phosphodiesterase